MTPLIKLFFEAYTSVLLSYSPEAISKHYQVPMAVYSDQGVQTVTDFKDAVSFWQAGVKPYKKQNIARAVPKIISEEQLSENVFLCKVQWKNYDKTGTEIGEETNFYILSKKKDELRISGLIIMGK